MGQVLECVICQEDLYSFSSSAYRGGYESESCHNFLGDDHLYPYYYIKNPEFNKENIQTVSISWNKLVKNTSSKFIEMKSNGTCIYTSAAQWFYEYLIEVLNDNNCSTACLDLLLVNKKTSSSDVNSNSNNVDNVNQKQLQKAEIFVNSVSELIELVEYSPNEAKLKLVELTLTLSKSGVYTIQYGIFGEIFLKCLQHCLDFELSEYAKISWTKLISIVLSIMIPISISEERRSLWEKYQNAENPKDKSTSKASTSLHQFKYPVSTYSTINIPMNQNYIHNKL